MTHYDYGEYHIYRVPQIKLTALTLEVKSVECSAEDGGFTEWKYGGGHTARKYDGSERFTLEFMNATYVVEFSECKVVTVHEFNNA